MSLQLYNGAKMKARIIKKIIFEDVDVADDCDYYVESGSSYRFFGEERIKLLNHYANGERLKIGITEKAVEYLCFSLHDVKGIKSMYENSLEDVKRLNLQIDTLMSENKKVNSELECYVRMPFIDKLKFLFGINK